MKDHTLTRRDLLKGMGSLGLLAALESLVPTYASANETVAASRISRRAGEPIDLFIANQKIVFDGRTGNAITVNGSLPGPLLRLKEGEDAVIRVDNRLKETSSIHWHGLIVPPEMDGVPGVSFAGIKPNETFVYKFPVKQYGTYWYHSHSGGQELLGLYAPLIIDPIEPDPFQYDRDYVVMLSDWSFESPAKIISNLKSLGNYYNFRQRTAGDFFSDASKNGMPEVLSDYMAWSRMRMDPTDLADVSGYTLHYLINGLSPNANWTGLFRLREKLRLRFINAGASTYFDVRIPGLKLTVVQADGQNIQPVAVEEFRIAPAETFDVIVEPSEDRAYTIFAETVDRSGYARGTLTPREGMKAEIPKQRPRPVLSMKEMGMDMGGMNMGGKKTDSKMPGMDMPQTTKDAPKTDDKMDGMNMPTVMDKSEIPGSAPVPHSKDKHGIGNQTVAMMSQARLGEPGTGLGEDCWRVLVYTDLKRLTMREDRREPEREIELHITGNMESYMWSFDGKKYSEAKTPIAFRYGERLRLTFVNDTMMAHPLHLHGMWMELENGNGHFIPRKHTVSVKPSERVSVAITADAPGKWAFHCHLLLHMEMGMFRVIEVSDTRAAEVTK